MPVLVRGTVQMKQGEIGMSFRHAPGKFLVIGRFLEKIVFALLPFLTMLVSARFIDLVLNQRMEEAIRDACLLGALILCQRLGGNLDTWMRIHQRKVLFPYLDEPTAAIDPVEESAVYEKFLQMVKGKTAVIVTHRLASARLADRILVMEKGRIAETGTHEELLAAGGLYSRMWKAQAENYVV